MKSNLRRTLLLILLLTLLTGCKTMDALGSLTQSDAEKSIQETMKSYAATVRWGYPGQMYNFLRADLAKQVEIPKNIDQYRVTQYKVIRPPSLVSEHKATQTVVIGYVNEARQVEHSLTDNQLWEYDAETKSWHRINMIPEYR